MIVERHKLPVLASSIHNLCDEIYKENPNAKLYVFGSLGRRFSLVGDNIELDDYMKAAENDKSLMPRKNFRGNTDIDIGIPEHSIPWTRYSSIARSVSLNHPGIEVDPHFLSITGNIIEIIGVAGEEFPMKKTPKPLEIKAGTVSIKDQSVHLHPFSIETQLKIIENYGKPQYKNFLEIARIVATQKNTNIYATLPKTTWIFLRYFTSIDWKKMSIYDTTKLLWRSLTTETLRRKLSQIRGKAKNIYNYNETCPVYL